MEDDDFVRRALACALADEFCIRVAVNVPEAIALLGLHPPAAILTDYHLPGGTGMDLLQRARRDHPAVRRVLYSGDLPQLAGDEAAIPHAFLTKPAPIAALLRALKGSDRRSA